MLLSKSVQIYRVNTISRFLSFHVLLVTSINTEKVHFYSEKVHFYSAV